MKIPKVVWLGLGHVFVVVGVAGLFLPVLPGVPILIVAAVCYSRGSRRFFLKLTRHKSAGPPIRRWLRYRTIPTKAKVFAVGGMVVGGAFSVYVVPALWAKVIIGCLVMLGCTYVLTRPSEVPA